MYYFIFVGVSAVSLLLSIVGVSSLKKLNPKMKGAILFLFVFALLFALTDITISLCGNISSSGGQPGEYSLELLIPAIACSIISLVLAICCAAIAMSHEKKYPIGVDIVDDEPNDNGDIFEDQIIESGQEVVLFTASANIGVGLWTSICKGCAAIFGIESKNYTKKMNRAEQRVRFRLTRQMLAHPEYEYSDFRIVKDGNLAYSGSVIGKLKKE